MSSKNGSHGSSNHRPKKMTFDEAHRRSYSDSIQKRRRIDDKSDSDHDDEPESHLVPNYELPSFLDGTNIFSKQAEPVLPVKDPTCDMAVNAKKGSKLVIDAHNDRETKRAQRKDWEIKNTKIGEILGVKDEEDKTARIASSYVDKYSKHLKKIEKTDRAKIIAQRDSLPIHKSRDELLDMLRENKIIIVVGETGSGKTTQLTQYLYQAGYSNYGCIACTQPRRVAAMSVAHRVAEEMDVELGKTVGYTIRFEDLSSKETKIKYMTDGVLLRESLTDPLLEQYSCIIMDEAHERSLNTDILFGLLKNIAAERYDFRLIITSATMDSEKFARFFSTNSIIKIKGRTFPVEIYHSASVVNDYVDQAKSQAVKIHIGTRDAGDILIFLPGQEEIEVCCDKIAESISFLKTQNADADIMELKILPMYSSLPPEKQAEVFKQAEEGTRKCVVSTNIAETSLTVDGIRFVIDSGYSRIKVFQPKLGIDALMVFPISQASANQRSGRAGRTSSGNCFRLYTETQYKEELLPSSVPEIQRSNLANVILLLKSLEIDDLKNFSFMDPPPQDNMVNSMHQLWMLGALNDKGQLTRLGRDMANFPLDPTMSRMLIASIDDLCSEEVSIIVAMLSVQNVFYRPEGREEDADRQRQLFYISESDHLTLLNVYKQWQSNKESPSWCTKHFLNYKHLVKARDVHEQLKHVMKAHRYKIRSSTNEQRIIRSICRAYFHQAAVLKNLREYENLRTAMPCQLHPTSSLFKMGNLPKYIIYHELIRTTKEYMHCASAVNVKWLVELGPKFYSLRYLKN